MSLYEPTTHSLPRCHFRNDKFLAQYAIPFTEIEGNGPVFRQTKGKSPVRTGNETRARAGGLAADKDTEVQLSFGMSGSYQHAAWPKPSAQPLPKTEAQYINHSAGRADLNYAAERYGTKSNVDARKPPPDAGEWRLRERKVFEDIRVPKFSSSNYQQYMKMFQPKIPDLILPNLNSIRRLSGAAPNETETTSTTISERALTPQIGDSSTASISTVTYAMLAELNDQRDNDKQVTYSESSTRLKGAKNPWQHTMTAADASVQSNSWEKTAATGNDEAAERSFSVKGGLDLSKSLVDTITNSNSVAQLKVTAEKRIPTSIKANPKDKGGSAAQKKVTDVKETPTAIKVNQRVKSGPDSQKKVTFVKNISTPNALNRKDMAASALKEKPSHVKAMPKPILKTNPKDVKPRNIEIVEAPEVKTGIKNAKAVAQQMIANILGTQTTEKKKPVGNILKKNENVGQRAKAGVQKTPKAVKQTISQSKQKPTPPAWKYVGQSTKIPTNTCKLPAKRAAGGRVTQAAAPHMQQCVTKASPINPKKAAEKPKAPSNRIKALPQARVMVPPVRILNCTYELHGKVNRPGFRREIQRYARAHNLCGTVTFTPHNIVRGVMEGRENDIISMQTWLTEKGTAPEPVYTTKFSEITRVPKFKNKGFLIKASTLLDERVELDEPWLWLDPDRNKKTNNNVNKKKHQKK